MALWTSHMYPTSWHQPTISSANRTMHHAHRYSTQEARSRSHCCTAQNDNLLEDSMMKQSSEAGPVRRQGARRLRRGCHGECRGCAGRSCRSRCHPPQPGLSWHQCARCCGETSPWQSRTAHGCTSLGKAFFAQIHSFQSGLLRADNVNCRQRPSMPSRMTARSLTYMLAGMFTNSTNINLGLVWSMLFAETRYSLRAPRIALLHAMHGFPHIFRCTHGTCQ